jgi:hypothetical protein
MINYPVNDKIAKALRRGINLRNRSALVHLLHIATTESKDHNSIWITSSQDYEKIEDFLSRPVGQRKKKHIAIYQAEEDWFYNCDYYPIRNRIKNHPNWTDQSFIVTNSRKDKSDSLQMGIKSFCRPAQTDLIIYRPYDCNLTGFSNITHHTGVCWDRYEPERADVWNLLNKYHENIIVAKIGNSWSGSHNNSVINNSPNEIIVGEVDCPYQTIESDHWWAQHMAFGTVLETQWRSTITSGYAPTTSEKIYRNMHLLRPAVICGGKNTRDYLAALGFDTWDWFINWEFDSEHDDEVRFRGYLKEIDRLLNVPLQQLKDLIYQNQDKLLYNRDRLFWLINNYNTIDI